MVSIVKSWESQPGTRCPMPEATQICLEGTDFRILRDGSAEDYHVGSTCMVYFGHVLSGTGLVPGNQVIIKEFYPTSKNVLFDIERREDGSLEIAESTKRTTEYKRKWEQFKQGYEYQKELSRSNAMEVAVKPLFAGCWGDSFYIISDAHMGADLKKVRPVTIAEKMAVAVSVAETMDILHENGYIMLDLKPENLLWIQRPNTVRIVDTDSLLPYKDPDRVRWQTLFANKEYSSPDIEFIRFKIQEGVTDIQKAAVRKLFLTPNADRYTMGVFLYTMFFGENPGFTDYGRYVRNTLKEGESELLDKLMRLYQETDPRRRRKTKEALDELLKIINKLLIESIIERMGKGYKTDKDIVSDLNDIYAGLSSKRLVLRKEIAVANARFAAYNLLQKYPLFNYLVKNTTGKSGMHVSIIGKHAMRKDMLSAVISVGQMLEQELTVDIVADDAESFWNSYISEDENPALAEAVTWEINGRMASNDIDRTLVDRSLAHIKICSETGHVPSAAYYIMLEEDGTQLQNEITTIQSLVKDSGRKIFIGILHNDLVKDMQLPDSMADTYLISTDAFTERYSEHMFQEKIYQMGLMAHTYYSNGMEPGANVDMEAMEAEFCEDIYNITSSERCALHGIYKMASLGIDRKKPGKFLEYFRRVEDPVVLEELSWLEHMSWTAFMLTSGAKPVSMDQFDDYAYRGGNDWKDKSDPKHLRHPMLAASKRHCDSDLRRLLSLADAPDEAADSLDPLDTVSWKIACWYKSKKGDFESSYRAWLEEVNTFCEKNACGMESAELVSQLEYSGLACIEYTGVALSDQDTPNKGIWKEKVEELRKILAKYKGGFTLTEKAERIMKPVFHSYDDRDFKQNDRDLTFAVIDMIA